MSKQLSLSAAVAVLSMALFAALSSIAPTGVGSNTHGAAPLIGLQATR